MSDKPGFDFVAEWQKMITEWEHRVNDISRDISQRKEFSAMMNEGAKMSHAAQKQLNEYTEKMLRSMNLPSLGKIDEIVVRLDRIEDAIDRLAARLENVAPVQRVPARAATRSRRPAVGLPDEKAADPEAAGKKADKR